MAYSEGELEAFRRKDMRMSIAGILQALINSGKFSKEELQEPDGVVSLAKEYRLLIWNSINKEEVENKEATKAKESEVKDDEVVEDVSDWGYFSKHEGCVSPTMEEMLVLDELWNRVENLSKFQLVRKIIEEFGKYPSKMSSVDKVLKVLSS